MGEAFLSWNQAAQLHSLHIDFGLLEVRFATPEYCYAELVYLL
jgi:hypothetical protein